MAVIYIDDKPFEVNPSKNLLQVIIELGFNLPYFCWHPALGSVGACRQCAVLKFRDENDKKGKLFMACMEPAADNTRISIMAPEAAQFRKGIIEWLMTNHPHDCPVCDEGGECHLQDMTMMTGHAYRRFRFNKRTHQNQYLGPFINHEMNRCIQCYRCVRFYRDYADGRDLDVFAAHHHVYFGRHADGVLENEFSGNLVEVCPTGVFTDKTLKQHYTRKWDLTMTPSICVHCSVGCNTIAGERYGGLRRIMSRYNGAVNGYFICDRGRFGYEFVNGKGRLKSPMTKSASDHILHPIDREETLRRAKETLKGRIIGIGSPRASLESNYALKRMVGPENFYAGESRKQFSLARKIVDILGKKPVKTPSLREIEKCDAVFILGEDITNTAPMMALAVRQAAHQKPMKIAQDLNIPHWHDAAVRELVQEQKGPVYIASVYPTRLDDISTHTFLGSPDEIVLLGNAVAGLLDHKAATLTAPDNIQKLAQQVASDLRSAEKPLIISGTGCLSQAVIETAYDVALALTTVNKNTRLSYTVPECNSMGLAMMVEKDLDDLMDSHEEFDATVILENDLYRRKGHEQVNRLLKRCKNLIVLDHTANGTSEKANLSIPVGTFAESDGTFVNNEGRAQRYYQAFQPFGEIWESWRWLGMISDAIDPQRERLKNFHDFVLALVQSHPQFRGIENLTPPPDFRIAGQKIPRQTPRYSGRTAMHAHKSVVEPKPAEDVDSPLTFTMEGYGGEPPSSIIPYFWSPGWNSQQSINKYQIEVGGPLHGGDPGLRLLEPNPDAKVEYFRNTGAAQAKIDWMRIIPKYHIFGGEELSAASPAIAQLSAEPYVGVSPADAEKLNLKEGDPAWVNMENLKVELKTNVIKGLPDGLIALPAGLPGFFYHLESKFATISKKRA